MNPTLERLMSQASRMTQLTRSGDLQAATAAIQAALAGAAAPSHKAAEGNNTFRDAWAAASASSAAAMASTARQMHDVIDVEAREVPSGKAAEKPADAPVNTPQAKTKSATRPGGEFVSGSFADASSSRDYKLYIPSTAGSQPLPLVVMLHGCTQNPDDFAAGTAMNEAAEAQGFYVLYPAQSQQANPQRCWNWFKHSHQARGRGEPALIAGMTREIMASHAIDPDRVFVAGLSAGGAMAAIMGKTYPELYAAVGVHSGLAAGVASDLPSAMSAMSGGGGGLGSGQLPGLMAGMKSGLKTGGQTVQDPPSGMPTIVFHGDADSTVHPGNGHQVITATAGSAARPETEAYSYPAGRTSTRSIYRSADGSVLAEHWLVHGAPHAWSGGSPKGSYTDPRGPDASKEMLRFFMAHPRKPAAG
ncbi:MAG: PHB depolymerase family esterase [Pseudomonadota bacterium]